MPPPRTLRNPAHATLCSLTLLLLSARARAEERTTSFDGDPGWDGRNHRATVVEPRTVRQDFGYSPTSHAGGAKGEIGGFISPASEPAHYARRIERKTFEDKLTASGTLSAPGREFHVLIGFFNSGTVNEWRTPNTVAIRLHSRGDVFYAYVEYATRLWRAGGDSPGGFSTVQDAGTGKLQLRGFPSSGVYTWSLRYDPDANQGAGEITATVGGEKAVCVLGQGHRADGAEFDRFGLLNVVKSPDGGGEVWLDDVTVLGEIERFDRDPGWDARGNRRTYVTENFRPRFDFGFSPTRYAGGKAAGELGGIVYRGDCRYPERLACFGDRVEPLSLAKPLRASGRVCLRRGVSDSTTLLGFFHSSESMKVSDSQASGVPRQFLGISIGGPSAEGFYFEPALNAGGGSAGSPESKPPRILPDGAAHDWKLEYSPGEPGRRGRIVVTLDGKDVSLELAEGDLKSGATFDRFGIVTTWIDGNAQEVYFDDLSYTVRQ